MYLKKISILAATSIMVGLGGADISLASALEDKIQKSNSSQKLERNNTILTKEMWSQQSQKNVVSQTTNFFTSKSGITK